MGAAKNTDNHSVAVTGLSCRFPGEGGSLNSFWKSICDGESAWSKIPKERFNAEAFWSATKKRNTSTTQGGHFLKQDPALFDANFFSLRKDDVEGTDPQQRIMIEVAYEACERAGLPLEKLAGSKTGVFMGHFTSDYKEMMYRDPESAPQYAGPSSMTTALSGRISWLWDLRGPCFTIDTACSSSLVAFHLACQSLRLGECDQAIVGGTSLLLQPELFMYLTNSGFISPDGRSKPFDESANGYGRGEGFGCVVLKRVDDAILNGDPIRAVIRGTGSNQDGHTKGLTVPSKDAQAELIQTVYREAGLDFSSTSYVEAHGTGTQAGDVEETQALARTLASVATPEQKLLIGSVKSNIGHLEAAAGIASIIKAVLVLEHGVIPPSINFKKLNPKLKFDEWKLKLVRELLPFPVKNGIRRVSVNGFGYCGTNAHAILDDTASYLKSRGITHNTELTGEPARDRAGPRLFVVSAQDKEGLKRVKQPLAEYVDAKADDLDGGDEAEEFLSELAYTLSERRSRLQWKTYAVASSSEELVDVLGDAENPALVAQSSRVPRIGFVFTGQGAQWPRMGMELMTYRVFRESVQAADRYLREECECTWSAVDELEKGKSSSRLALAEFSQALCTVLHVALVDLLRTWNIHPTAVAGHSSGEIGAAYAMGALTKEDAWRVAYYRGILSTEAKANNPEVDGSMMAAGLSPEKAEEWFKQVTAGTVVVACINSPTSVTISGDTAGIDQLAALLKEAGVFARKLQVDQAYHSPHMQAISQDYYELLADLEPMETDGKVTMHSSVIGGIIQPKQLGAMNWVRNLVSPVKFAPAIHDMLRPLKDGKRAEENAIELLVELGPHAALQGPATQTLKAHGITNIPYQSVVTRNQNAIDTALNLAGSLWAQGYPVNIQAVNADAEKHFAAPLFDLPSYPWKHTRYYHDNRVEKEYACRAMPRMSLIGGPAPSFGEREHLWRGFIRPSEEPWVHDHKIQGATLYPGAGYIAMALEAAHQTADVTKTISSYKLRDIQLLSAGMIQEDADLECIVQLRPHLASTRDSSSTWTEFTVTTSPDGKSLVKNCTGLLLVEYESEEGSEAAVERNYELQAQKSKYLEVKEACTIPLNTEEFYTDLTALGLQYGPAFANVIEGRHTEGLSQGVVEIPDLPYRIVDGQDRPHIIHPGTLDAIFHLAFAAVKGPTSMLAMVPKTIDEVTISAKIAWTPGTKLPGFCKSQKYGMRELTADIVMLDDSENLPSLEIKGFLCAEIAGGSSNGAATGPKSITSKLAWKPAVDLLTTEELNKALAPFEGADKTAEYLRLLHHSNPAVSILEIADSTIFARSDLASVLKTADVTIATVDSELKEGLEKAATDAKVEVLDFSDHLGADALKDRSYDVVIASDLGASASQAEVVVGNIAQVLKAGGKLVTLGDIAQATPALSSEGIETVVAGISSKKADVNGNGASDVDSITFIQPAGLSEKALAFASELRTAVQGHGYETEVFAWGEDVSALVGKACISLVELEKSILEDLTEANFNAIQKLILESASLFWVTAFTGPASTMIDGLARVVRHEAPGLNLRTFHADEATLSSGRLSNLVDRAFSSKSEDDEYLVKDDLLQISRVEEDTPLNDQINGLLPGAAKVIANIPLKEAQYPVKMSIQTPGQLDSIILEVDEEAETELEPEFVEIQVKASSVNSREVQVAMGSIPDSLLGLDAAGVVTRVGSAVTKFKAGDRVSMYGHGAHRTLHRSRADFCAIIPEEMTFEQAATVPTIHGAAWNALVRLARVRKGQSVLIHAAAGGVGQAAIQIAKHFGMEIFVTAGSVEKREMLRDAYGIAEDHIFDSRDVSFAKGIKRITNGRGVDVILNSLTGEALRQTWNCIAPFGYFVEMGVRDILSNTGLDMRPFMQNATFSFSSMTQIEKSRPDVMAEIVEGAWDFFRQGISKPVQPIVPYPISQIETAFNNVHAGKHIGKLVFTWGADDVVPVVQQMKSTLRLNPEGVYVLVGGLGGLGRSLSMKLASLGARKLVFLSRSGAKAASAKELVRDLEAEGVQVQAHVCDVASEESVAASVKKATTELGTIRGVFQCAMVLRDILFTNMTHQQWIESTRPKVQGSWNLHKYLPDVDFFITLSSFAGVFGNRGQGNYAAAGAYEDALAFYRRANGQKATTVDLGIMRDVGVLAETGLTDSLSGWEKPWGIRENEFHALMERTIDGDIKGTTNAQVITGLATGGSVIAAGIDSPYYLDNARFGIMARTGTRNQASDSGSSSAPTHTLVAAATSLDEAANATTEALCRVVAKVLQMPVEEIDTSRFLHSYGIDSLVAIEVVNWALKDVKATITVFDVLAGIPITTLCGKIASKSSALPKELAAN